MALATASESAIWLNAKMAARLAEAGEEGRNWTLHLTSAVHHLEGAQQGNLQAGTRRPGSRPLARRAKPLCAAAKGPSIGVSDAWQLRSAGREPLGPRRPTVGVRGGGGGAALGTPTHASSQLTCLPLCTFCLQ